MGPSLRVYLGVCRGEEVVEGLLGVLAQGNISVSYTGKGVGMRPN
jgi:hypothetical protein